MVLPNAERAEIDPAKITGYLLSSGHPIGRYKRPIFLSLGYSLEQWTKLRDDLLAHTATGEVVQGQYSKYGQKYEVRGILTGPSGKQVAIKSVWIILVGDKNPRFVTAFPGEKT